jgi:hypothetical protein
VVTTRVRRIALGIALALALGLLVGAVSAGKLIDSDDSDATSIPAYTPTEGDPHPLSTGTTPEAVKTQVFERAYSECSSTPVKLLASKYKAADTSDDAVAAIVGRAWASYFKAGADAVPDGRAACLQGLENPTD